MEHPWGLFRGTSVGKCVLAGHTDKRVTRVTLDLMMENEDELEMFRSPLGACGGP